MKDKNSGFISMSLIYSFFIVFVALSISLLAIYSNNLSLVKTINKDIKTNLEKKLNDDLVVYNNLIRDGSFELSKTSISNSEFPYEKLNGKLYVTIRDIKGNVIKTNHPKYTESPSYKLTFDYSYKYDDIPLNKFPTFSNNDTDKKVELKICPNGGVASDGSSENSMFKGINTNEEDVSKACLTYTLEKNLVTFNPNCSECLIGAKNGEKSDCYLSDESVYYEKGQKYSYNQSSLAGIYRKNYIFLGWFTEASSGTKITSDMVSNNDMTLYAHWKGKERKVIFDSNGGSFDDDSTSLSKIYDYGDSIGTLPLPIKKGYKFEGWFTQITDGKKIADNDDVLFDDDNTTLYARWSVKSYNVIFDPGDGEIEKSSGWEFDENGYPKKIVEYDTKIGAFPELKLLEGKTFVKWVLSTDDTKTFTENTVLSYDEDVHLIAKYSINTYEVTFDHNLPEIDDEKEVFVMAYGDSFPTVILEQDGYEFLGWYYEKHDVFDVNHNLNEPVDNGEDGNDNLDDENDVLDEKAEVIDDDEIIPDYIDFGDLKVNSDIIFYAGWKRNPDIVKVQEEVLNKVENLVSFSNTLNITNVRSEDVNDIVNDIIDKSYNETLGKISVQKVIERKVYIDSISWPTDNKGYASYSFKEWSYDGVEKNIVEFDSDLNKNFVVMKDKNIALMASWNINEKFIVNNKEISSSTYCKNEYNRVNEEGENSSVNKETSKPNYEINNKCIKIDNPPKNQVYKGDYVQIEFDTREIIGSGTQSAGGATSLLDSKIELDSYYFFSLDNKFSFDGFDNNLLGKEVEFTFPEKCDSSTYNDVQKSLTKSRAVLYNNGLFKLKFIQVNDGTSTSNMVNKYYFTVKVRDDIFESVDPVNGGFANLYVAYDGYSDSNFFNVWLNKNARTNEIDTSEMDSNDIDNGVSGDISNDESCKALYHGDAAITQDTVLSSYWNAQKLESSEKYCVDYFVDPKAGERDFYIPSKTIEEVNTPVIADVVQYSGNKSLGSRCSSSEMTARAISLKKDHYYYIRRLYDTSKLADVNRVSVGINDLTSNVLSNNTVGLFFVQKEEVDNGIKLNKKLIGRDKFSVGITKNTSYSASGKIVNSSSVASYSSCDDETRFLKNNTCYVCLVGGVINDKNASPPTCYIKTLQSDIFKADNAFFANSDIKLDDKIKVGDRINLYFSVDSYKINCGSHYSPPDETNKTVETPLAFYTDDYILVDLSAAYGTQYVKDMINGGNYSKLKDEIDATIASKDQMYFEGRKVFASNMSLLNN